GEPEDAAEAERAVLLVDRGAGRADGAAGAGRAGKELGDLGRRARRAIRGRDAVLAVGLPAMLAQELARLGIEEPDGHAVPLDGEAFAHVPGRGAVVRALDLDAAVEVHGARAVLVVAKRRERQRPQRGLLFGKHGRDLALRGPVDARVGPAGVPVIEVRLAVRERLEAHPAQRRALRVPDGRLRLPLAIGMADAAWERDDAVVREDVAVERVERRVVDVGREHPLLEIVEDDGLRHAAEPAKRLLVELRPDPRTRLPGQEPDRLAAVAEGENEEARAAVLAGLRMADHRAVAVSVDTSLAGFAGGSVDTPLAGFGTGRRPQPPGDRTAIPAAFKYALAVSRRTPVASSIRRSGHPSRPSTSTSCRFASLKTLAIPATSPKPVARSTSEPLRYWPVFSCRSLAGFGCPPRFL